MKILVTGAAGRLGREVTHNLVLAGHEVAAFDLPNVDWGQIRDQMEEIFKGDITDQKLVLKATDDVDAVIHLAALLPPRSESDMDLTFSVNVGGVKNIIGALEQRKEVPVIFASSISTYGITFSDTPPISEDRPLRAHNVYSESKVVAENLIRYSKVPFVILRIAPIAVVDLVELPDRIPYGSDQRVEFVYTSDAALALSKAAISSKSLFNTYNIAGGSSWQMTGSDYIREFYDALGVEVEPHFSEDYTAVDWYDTSRSRSLSYQRTTFNMFLEKLKVLGEQLGLR